MNELSVLFSPSTCGAYVPGINTSDIPEDVIEIPRAYWLSLLQQLAVSPKRISVNPDNGYPILMDPPPLTVEQATANEYAWRNGQLTATDRLIARDRDEMDDGGGTTLDQTQYTALQAYRRALRDWPKDEFFPEVEHRPVAPPWLAGQL
ncbi:phage tail assembly chaperone [Pseudomonas sp. FW300-N2F2]|uniref:phage tail assembly chaperone n=1 Tax=Pseudomonas sp. FW300-N2F2 TaxID=2751320 RepID=UPI001A925A80|nr:phage tail assembly chaperone [Pseudomonas sp. FW300-N2F2]